ncbi:MAG TPA: hypothetical protein VK673_20465 [Chthoniobacterales bacterium]|nr:hypothetical protein [Chthoniobacterales bacterium]
MAQTVKGAANSQDAKVAFGVETLIERLRGEGVASGRAEADKIVKNARSDAETILSKARAEAEQIVTRARTEAANLEKAGRQALELAARDMTLDLKNRLLQRAARAVEGLVNKEVQREDILEKLILEVAGQARENSNGAKTMEVILPQRVVTLEDLAKDPVKYQGDSIGKFADLSAKNLLRQGVTLTASPDVKSGIKVLLTDKGVELDLSDQAIADLLWQHLQPRFRALFEGII